MYYADALPRRARLTPLSDTRLHHITALLQSYYAAPWRGRVSPERASLALGDSPVSNPDATGGYYLQGELLGDVIDALVRDSTSDRRNLDDVMRALYERSAGGRGFTSNDIESVVRSVCGCDVGATFREQVRGSATIDVRPMRRDLGWTLIVDTVAASDSAGRGLPDVRVSVDYTNPGSPLGLVVADPASGWARSGVRTGDKLRSFDGAEIGRAAEFRQALSTVRIGDTVTVAVDRSGSSEQIRVPIAAYARPRVSIVDAMPVTAAQRARRTRWLSGR